MLVLSQLSRKCSSKRVTAYHASSLRRCVASLNHKMNAKKSKTEMLDLHAFSVAPMMDYTNVFQRTFFRYISQSCVLYTEMVTANALLNSNKVEHLLRADMSLEDPLVLQLGGSDPISMGKAAKIAATNFGYKQMNINVGCPSEKVSGDGCFGAKLMLSGRVVADIAQEINDQTSDMVSHPVSVKCRIGINEYDEYTYEDLLKFIQDVSERGNVEHFVVHARRAILNASFSPKDNRTIPPLNYDVVYSLIKAFPHLHFSINGGIETFEEVKKHQSEGVVGSMVGRHAIKAPYYWRKVDSTFYNCADPGLTRRDILLKYANFLKEFDKSSPDQINTIKSIAIKPVLSLFFGESNSVAFKRFLTEGVVSSKKVVARGKGQDRPMERPLHELLLSAMDLIDADILDER